MFLNFLTLLQRIIIFWLKTRPSEREDTKRRNITIYKSRKNNNNERCTRIRCVRRRRREEKSVTNHDDFESWHRWATAAHEAEIIP